MSVPVEKSPDEFQPASQLELSRFVRDNAAGDRRTLYAVGGRTALHYGLPPRPAGVFVSTAKLNRIVDYPARDMTVTVESGVRFQDLAALLRTERQQLPIDAPQSNRATLGGVAATNAGGSRRFGYGTLRDYVIGVSAVDARGRTFKAGGRVVKNVAGYDLCKLLVGSLGTLAITAQLTLKLKPLPEASAMLWASFADAAALDSALARLAVGAARPVIVDALNPAAARLVAAESRLDLPTGRPALLLAVEGSPREVRWQTETLHRELQADSPLSVDAVDGDEAERLLQTLTDFAVGSEEPVTFRASVPPSRVAAMLELGDAAGAALQAHAGNGVVVGHLSEEVGSAERAGELLAPFRDLAAASRGALVVQHCVDAWRDDLLALDSPPAPAALMQRLKRRLDPDGLLNPGR